jgi:hypothetical protein
VFGRVPECSAESLRVRVQLSPCVFGRVPACSAEFLHVRPRPKVFGRVPGWRADSFPDGNSRQREAVSVFNPRDFEVPLPTGRLQCSG